MKLRVALTEFQWGFVCAVLGHDGYEDLADEIIEQMPEVED